MRRNATSQKMQSLLLTHKWAISKEGMSTSVIPMLHMEGGDGDDDGDTTINEARKTATGKFPTYLGNDGEPLIDPNAEAERERIKGGVAILPIRGVMLVSCPEWAEVYFNVCSTERLTADVKRIRAMGVKAIICRMRTPGGHVSGVEGLNREIRAAIADGIEVHVYVDDLCCSAGVFSTASATSVTLCGQTAEIGSIGTMLAFYDDTKWMEDIGFKYVEVYAAQSTLKNEEWRAYDKDGNLQPMIDGLTDLNEVFLDAVREGRGDKLNKKDKSVLQGRVFMGDAAVAAGLADGIGTLEDVIATALGTSTTEEEEEEKASASTTNNPAATANTPEPTMSKFAIALAAIATYFKEAIAPGQAITEETLKEANTELGKQVHGVEIVTSASLKELRDKANAKQTADEALTTATAEATKADNELRTSLSATLKEYSVEHASEATTKELVTALTEKLKAATEGKPAATHSGGGKKGDDKTASKTEGLTSLDYAAKTIGAKTTEPAEA